MLYHKVSTIFIIIIIIYILKVEASVCVCHGSQRALTLYTQQQTALLRPIISGVSGHWQLSR